MALFGAIVVVGLGPALWLGVQFAQAGQLPVGPPPIIAENRGGTVSSPAASPDATPVDTARREPRIVPAGPRTRGHGGAADFLTPRPSTSRSSSPTPSVSPSTDPVTEVSASPTASPAPASSQTATAPGVDSEPRTNVPDPLTPFSEPGSPPAVLARG